LADNTLLNAGSGGNTFRSLEDGSSIQWPVGVTAFATTVGTPDVLSIVTPTAGLPVRLADGSGYISTLPVSLASVPSHAVTNAGTFAVQVDGAALTALQLIDNLVLAEDAAHASGDPGVQMLAVRRDTPGAGVGADGDYVALAVDANGYLLVSLPSAISVNATQSGSWSVESISGNITPGTDATHLGKAEDAAHASGDTGVAVWAVRRDAAAVGSGTDGDYSSLNVDSSGRLWCNVGNTVTISGAVTNAGTFVVQENGAALTALQIMDDWDNAASDGASVSGDVAHDAADAGEPVKLGAKAESGLSGITLVADGDRTNLHAGLDGVLIVRPHTNLEDVVSERTTNTDGASTAFASGLAAPGAGIYLRITSVTICNSSASFCTVDLRDGAAGSVLWTLPVPATGGVVQTFDPPLKLSANTALAFDASAATSTLTISALGFKAKV
jgi:hypothetical protein